jgi:hypothetical protein
VVEHLVFKCKAQSSSLSPSQKKKKRKKEKSDHLSTQCLYLYMTKTGWSQITSAPLKKVKKPSACQSLSISINSHYGGRIYSQVLSYIPACY